MCSMLLLAVLGLCCLLPADSWQLPAGGESYGRPSFSSDSATVYTAARGNPAVRAIAAATGRLLWNKTLPCHPHDPVWQKEIGCGAIGSVVLSHDERVLFAAGADRALWALAVPKNGVSSPPSVLWRHSLGGPAAGITGGAVLSDDGKTVFVTAGENKNTTNHSFGNRVNAVDAATGRSLWSVRRCAAGDGPCDANTSPTYHDGLVLVGDGAGWLYALKATTGEDSSGSSHPLTAGSMTACRDIRWC